MVVRDGPVQPGPPSNRAFPARWSVYSNPDVAVSGGPVAQWLEQATHNRSVPGSNPGGPTTSDQGISRLPSGRSPLLRNLRCGTNRARLSLRSRPRHHHISHAHRTRPIPDDLRGHPRTTPQSPLRRPDTSAHCRPQSGAPYRQRRPSPNPSWFRRSRMSGVLGNESWPLGGERRATLVPAPELTFVRWRALVTCCRSCVQGGIRLGK